MTTSNNQHEEHLSLPGADLPRLAGQPDQPNFADFWIAYQWCEIEGGQYGWEQVYYGENKNEVLDALQQELRGLGLKKQDLGHHVRLHRDGTTLFMVLHQLLNYGWFGQAGQHGFIRSRVPKAP